MLLLEQSRAGIDKKESGVKSDKKMTAFGEWIMAEAERENLSLREFAARCGLTHGSLSRYTKAYGPGEKQSMPGLKEVNKLSQCTGVSVELIFKFLFPDRVDGKPLSARALMVGQRFDEMPQEVRDVIWGIEFKKPFSSRKKKL